MKYKHFKKRLEMLSWSTHNFSDLFKVPKTTIWGWARKKKDGTDPEVPGWIELSLDNCALLGDRMLQRLRVTQDISRADEIRSKLVGILDRALLNGETEKELGQSSEMDPPTSGLSNANEYAAIPSQGFTTVLTQGRGMDVGLTYFISPPDMRQVHDSWLRVDAQKLQFLQFFQGGIPDQFHVRDYPEYTQDPDKEFFAKAIHTRELDGVEMRTCYLKSDHSESYFKLECAGIDLFKSSFPFSQFYLANSGKEIVVVSDEVEVGFFTPHSKLTPHLDYLGPEEENLRGKSA